MSISSKNVHFILTNSNSLAISCTRFLPYNKTMSFIEHYLFSVSIFVVLLIADRLKWFHHGLSCGWESTFVCIISVFSWILSSVTSFLLEIFYVCFRAWFFSWDRHRCGRILLGINAEAKKFRYSYSRAHFSIFSKLANNHR